MDIRAIMTPMRSWLLLAGAALAGCSSRTKAKPDAASADAGLLPCTPFDVTFPITPSAAGPGNPVWIGDRYVVALSPTDLRTLSPDGQLGATAFANIMSSDGSIETIVWTGSLLGVLAISLASPPSLQLLRFGPDGSRLGATLIAQDSSLGPFAELVWAGDRFFVAWIIQNPPEVANVREVSADGVAGTPRTLTSTDVGAPFQLVDTASATSTSYAIMVSDVSGPSTIVLIDRTTGAIAHAATTDPPWNIPEFVVRNDLLSVFAAASGSATFAPVQPSAALGNTVSIPFAINFGVAIASATGYHASGVGSVAMSAYPIEVIDLDASGAASGSASTVMTVPSNGSYSAPIVASRGNGYLVGAGYGNTTISTAHFVQLCDP